jgi:hypothetical protein
VTQSFYAHLRIIYLLFFTGVPFRLRVTLSYLFRRALRRIFDLFLRIGALTITH